MSEQLTYQLVNYLVEIATNFLIPAMGVIFLIGCVFKVLIYFTVRMESTFAKEFEKRVHLFLAGRFREDINGPFHRITEGLLQKTYYEIFELKQKYRRRRWDHISILADRIFLIQDGAARLVRDTLAQTKYLKRDRKVQPKFINISKFVFSTNPVFNRILGLLPMNLFNDLLSILPGLFVIGGIFGTFLGVMKALPMLSDMDITNVESTREVMGMFLVKISFSMSTSIVGIIFSVAMTIINAVLSVEDMYMNLVNKFTASLEFLWNDADVNVTNVEQDKDRRAMKPHVSAFVDSDKKAIPFEEFVPRPVGGDRPVVEEPIPPEAGGEHALPEEEASKGKGKAGAAVASAAKAAKSLSSKLKPKPAAKAKPAKAAPRRELPELKRSVSDPTEGSPQERLELIKKKIDKLYVERKNGKIDKPTWVRRHEKLTSEKEALEAEIANADVGVRRAS